MYNKVYDVTEFLSRHPGGEDSILRLAGTDATEDFDPIHPPEALSHLPETCCLGNIGSAVHAGRGEAEAIIQGSGIDQRPVESLLSLQDIESTASKVLKSNAQSYFQAASDSRLTKDLNSQVYSQVLFRPQVFKPLTNCPTETNLLSGALHVKTPVFAAPAALARLAHQDGEAAIARTCKRFGAMQLISNSASMSPEAIGANAPQDQIFGWQLYIQSDYALSESMLKRISKIPAIKFIALMLDACIRGKWEDDLRLKATGRGDVPSAAIQTGSQTLFSGTATNLQWGPTIAWLRRHANLPIVLKGIQTYEDAILASRCEGVHGIILSNHGGRSLDGAPPALYTLMEIRRYAPDVFKRIDIWIDGGVKRGTDVIKAMCLGTKAVGLGRAPLYGLAIGGQRGVERMFDILQRGIEAAMRFLGVTEISQLQRKHVNAKALADLVFDEELENQIGALQAKESLAKL